MSRSAGAQARWYDSAHSAQRTEPESSASMHLLQWWEPHSSCGRGVAAHELGRTASTRNRGLTSETGGSRGFLHATSWKRAARRVVRQHRQAEQVAAGLTARVALADSDPVVAALPAAVALVLRRCAAFDRAETKPTDQPQAHLLYQAVAAEPADLALLAGLSKGHAIWASRVSS
jgi:hypothetical protein